MFAPLTAEQVTLYEATVRETMEAIETKQGIERAGLVFKLLTALKQICNHPAQYLKQPGPLDGRSGKLAAFDELTEVILANRESMLVFTQYTQMAALLQQHLDARGIGSLFLHGGVPVPRRDEMVTPFQAGDVPVFLLSLKAGGTGLTLTRATHVLHYDRWWNPAVEDQATDRAYRIGLGSVPMGTPGRVIKVGFFGSYDVDFGRGRVLHSLTRDALRIRSGSWWALRRRR